MKGSVSKLAMSHTTSRVLQAAAKAAGPKARADALKEISPDLLTLAKSSYGHFLATKLISLAPKEEVPGKNKWVLVRGLFFSGGGGGGRQNTKKGNFQNVPTMLFIFDNSNTALSFRMAGSPLRRGLSAENKNVAEACPFSCFFLFLLRRAALSSFLYLPTARI